MRIAVAGGAGFIGCALTKALLNRKDEVWIISRSSSKEQRQVSGLHHVTWTELEAAPSLMDGIDAIVNLAGESINQRWTAAAKQRIMFGEMSALLLDGQRAVPRKALGHGFTFRYPTIASAMQDLVGRK
ncbi:DUF1731 domain-containing protein [Paenibacillus alkaliterrae]|uniref:DUF1731 domain-containing protein n=1 Tax=Paenibacillus alkaliterrae TaxID=320909 RepID=UPI001F1FE799|nr:DUF1731 domain-containing protein [Paenibacillus alkaliterrae]MCF2940759.1 DUF1731 domain-containing protein [Paenibacillus alkaliterrae]